MKIFGLAGWSGSGKTMLMVRLIPALIARGVSVSTMKHAHHAFDVDQPGKDSYEHRAAGATEVMVSSNARWALMHELRGAPEASVEELIQHMTPVDLLIIEGFKRHAHPKLEVHRPSVGKPLLCTDDPHIVAVASDAPVPGLRVPLLDLNDVASIADFIISHCGLARARAASAG
jgi:molybdopterin-guanine dinucleotide biosynthesis adapter protein